MQAIKDTFLGRNRIASIDITRGIIMVIMALDHVRDFFHSKALLFDPLALDRTTPALFFTRWITHFCAPTFIFLAGTSIFLSRKRKSKAELSWFLFTRGCWLLFLDVVVMRFGYSFNFYYDMTILNILWGIGLCMIGMAAAVHLPDLWTLILGLALVFGHNALDGFQPQTPNFLNALWVVLMRFGILTLSPDHRAIVSYPALPWLGIMLLGYAAGQLYLEPFDARRRRRLLIGLGLLAIIVFVGLRLLNTYGDPSHWSSQKTTLFTIMSFLNCTKYPVSLLFTLMTIGPMLILLGVLDSLEAKALGTFRIFGRVPLFYFILHFYFAHAGALMLYMHSSGKPLSQIDFHFGKSFGGITPGSGYSLTGVYLAWIVIVLIMFPLCYWYDRYKTNRRYRWLSYL